MDTLPMVVTGPVRGTILPRVILRKVRSVCVWDVGNEPASQIWSVSSSPARAARGSRSTPRRPCLGEVLGCIRWRTACPPRFDAMRLPGR
ncbi:hypothetical protein A5788_01525 [Gordonia sp. 852002-50816_SCH5313054-c]|nr:hypothetical protein A5788_01525 [Gordonia sp. 852002-50816_SCH5313054-c]